MAVVLESAASVAPISHHAAAAAAAMVPASSPSISAQALLPLPRSRGLKVYCSITSSVASRNPHHRAHLRASRGVVSEQQQEVAAPAGVVSDKSWKELVLESDTPVLVDFWAPWCGPCRMIAPIVDELAKMYAGRIRCFKLNTDESPNKATEYGIRSIPTVLIFKGGEKRDTIVGAVPKAKLVKTIEKYLDR